MSSASTYMYHHVSPNVRPDFPLVWWCITFSIVRGPLFFLQQKSTICRKGMSCIHGDEFCTTACIQRSRWATCGDSLLGRNLWGYNTNRGMGGGLRWWKGKCLQSGAHFMTRFPIQQGFWLGGSNVYCFQQYLGWLWEYIYTHFLGMFKQIHHQQLESEE
jgi:hypothetical protein